MAAPDVIRAESSAAPPVSPGETRVLSTEVSPAFDRAAQACDEALDSHPHLVRESHFLFGGRRVQMRIVGDELSRQLTRPFAHLRIPVDNSAHTALTVDVWDEREAHVPYPNGDEIDPSETRWPAGNGQLAVSAGSRYVRYECVSWVTWIDRVGRRVVGWRANAARLSMHERTRPIPFLLPIWYSDAGIEVVHAGLVARDNKGVLFCGSNGAGKSTSSLACLCGGLDFLSDDHVGITEHDGSFVGHSVFGSTRLEPDHLVRFPSLAPHAIASPDWYETKSLILVNEAMPSRTIPSVPIRAIVLPIVKDIPFTRIVPTSRAEVLRSLAPSTLMQMPFGSSKWRFDQLARLAMSAPGYRLELGHDINGIAPRVAELIDALD